MDLPSLRPATDDDSAVLLGFIRAFYEHENIPYDPAQLRLALGALMANSALGQVWLIEAEDTPIGYLVLAFVFMLEFSGRCAFIDELFISPGDRSRGYGTYVLHWVEQACRTMGLAAMRLEVEYANHRAGAMYAKAGFQRHDRFILTKRLKSSFD